MWMNCMIMVHVLPGTYQWLSARLQHLHCIVIGDPACFAPFYQHYLMACGKNDIISLRRCKGDLPDSNVCKIDVLPQDSGIGISALSAVDIPLSRFRLIIYNLQKYHLCNMISENSETTHSLHLCAKWNVIWIELCISKLDESNASVIRWPSLISQNWHRAISIDSPADSHVYIFGIFDDLDQMWFFKKCDYFSPWCT